MRTITAFLTTALLAAPLPAIAQQAPHTIYVSAQGSVVTHPDYAVLDVGVVSRARTARDALSADSEKMNAVVAALRGLVPAADDIQTASFSIGATYAQGANGQTDYSRIDGYEVANKVTVKVRDLAKVAAVIDAAVAAGANASNSVAFSIDDYEKYYDLAQADAVRGARHRAQIMAAAEHATVGAVIAMTSIPPSYGGAGVVYSSSPVTALGGGGAPILPGTITISATAYVTFALK